MGKALTKARKAALEYVRDNGPVKMFPVQGPSLRLVNKMADEGLFDRLRPSAFGFIRYSITPAGRAALSEGEP